MEINWRPICDLRIGGYVDFVRKGGRADIAKQYECPSLPFLYGNVYHRALQDVFFEYSPYHNILLRGDLTFGDIQNSGENTNWKLLLKYGI